MKKKKKKKKKTKEKEDAREAAMYPSHAFLGLFI